MAEWLLGADEAGRGSLVGEMIVAVAAVPRGLIPRLREMGVRDSKKLTPQARAQLYRELSGMIPFAVTPVRPAEIDSENLTILTEMAIASAVERLLPRIGGPSGVARIVVDRYGRQLKLGILLRRLGYKGPLIVEEKADDRYVEVSAASIIAKHVRDARIRALSSLYGVRGSGYPSDERTVEWVLEVISRGERPPIIRYSWGTLEGTGLRVKKKPSSKPVVTLDDFF